MQHHRISLLQLSRLSGYAYSSLKRWCARARSGLSVINKPGPKKADPVNLAQLSQDISHLKHRRKRSHGSGRLHRRYGKQISRRELDSKIHKGRKEHQARQRSHSHRIEWNVPGLAWAVDDTLFSRTQGWIHTIRDLASRYTLEPITGALAHGEQIAAHLEHLFRIHGAPLVLKRDNGSNLNHAAVNELLTEWLVIPLNSPTAYPKYNGAVENAQRDWNKLLPQADGSLQHRCPQAAHELNHRPRRILKGRTPCAVFNGPDKLNINRNQRKEAIKQIKELTLETVDRTGHNSSHAYRTAVQTWLHMNQLIRIRKPKNCYPVL